MTEDTASMLCIFAYAPQPEFIPTSGLYISPSCFLSLMRLFAHSNLDTKAAQDYMRFVMTRLKSPDVSLSQLASQTSLFPDPRPSIEYLWQFTRISGGFSALLQAGSIDSGYPPAVVPGIAEITIIAANHDSALKVEPVELEPLVVPDFLEALSWTLPQLSSSDDKKLYHRFILASSVLLVVACDDTESRAKILAHPDRTTLLRELRDDKDTYTEFVSEEEWERLIDGLALEESEVEGTEGDIRSDEGEIFESREAPNKDGGSSGGEEESEARKLRNGRDENTVNVMRE
ncbi:unnamed protein product [Rhizoctonia solani]|uniref:Uncharacterized protein n=1 Tax=Rhizoctonia solani TaxID=456999 RepID=A0A8H3BI14_9AGAM|nr:unnamed protein product [Rhizoctonia solani]